MICSTQGCNNPASHVFKAHAPSVVGTAKYADSVNLWLCRNCAWAKKAQKFREKHYIIERYPEVLFVEHTDDEDETASLLYHIDYNGWQYGYTINGRSVYFERRAKIYWTAS